MVRAAASSCPVGSTCGSVQRSTFYTRADVTDATPVSVYGNQFGVSDPEWVTNARALVFGGFGSQVSIDDLGGGDYSFTPWMTPNRDMGDGEVSRDGQRLATTWDYGDDKIVAFWAVNGDVRSQTPPPAPDAACSTSTPDAQYADPTWSPDSSGIAIQDSAGIEVMHFTAFGADLCAVAGSSVLSATGSEPDWGPADPPAAAWTPPAPAVPTPTPASPAPRAPAAALTVSVGRVTVAALRAGLRVQVKLPVAGRVSVRLTRAGRTLASGATTARHAGRVTVRLARIARASALRHRTLTLDVTVSQSRTRATRSVRVA